MQTITLQDAISFVADNMRDLTLGTTTQNTAATNQMTDASRVGVGKDAQWVGSQVVLLQPEAGAAGLVGNTPFDVTGYNKSTGLFTFSRDFNATSGVPANVPYMLIRTRGQGTPYRGYIRALTWALAKLNLVVPDLDSNIITAAADWDYTIPPGITHVYDITTEVQGQVWGFRPETDWRLRPGRKLILNRGLPVEMNLPLTLSVLRTVTLPTTPLGTMTVPLDELVDFASEYLGRTSPRASDMQKAGNLQQERLRFSSSYLPPNAVEVI